MHRGQLGRSAHRRHPDVTQPARRAADITGMSIHRDDHDAALARIDALEQELRRAVHDSNEARRLADQSERERDAAKRDLERVRDALHVLTPNPEPPPHRVRRPATLGSKIGTMLFGVAAFMLLIGCGLFNSQSEGRQAIAAVLIVVSVFVFIGGLGLTLHPRQTP
ncbi:MAG: hypothetical protein QM831_04245 [Kofleriaceae bacterium]